MGIIGSVLILGKGTAGMSVVMGLESNSNKKGEKVSQSKGYPRNLCVGFNPRISN